MLFLIGLLSAGAAQALVPGDCARTTHVSHGGEADHVDLGEGRVMWRNWWSQEGTATDITVMDCAPGQALTARTAEENMGQRLPFSRTEDAMAVILLHEEGARVFATLNRIADSLSGIARDVRVEVLTQESCACAAFYPDLRGDKTTFKLEGL
jgi:hypothetical protein